MSQLPESKCPALGEWLKTNGLEKYANGIKEAGYNSLEDLLKLLSESQMREIGGQAKMLPMDKYKFIKAIVSAKQTYNKYTEEQIKAYFKSFDTDGDGMVTAKELKEGLSKIGQKVTDEQINSMIKDVDEDGNGELDYEEFCKVFNIESSKIHFTEEEIKDLFKSFDTDGDGMVTAKELKEGLKKIGRANVTDEQVNQLLKNVDEDGNGELDYDEFKQLLTSVEQLTYTPEEIQKLYKSFDTDGDGMVTATELKEGLIKLGRKVTDEDVNQLLKNVDEDGNGELDFDEFSRLFS